MGKGASNQQNSIANSQQNFMSALQSDFGTAFAGQQNVITGLNKYSQNIIAGGPSQFGFSAPQTTALNTLATSNNAAAYQGSKAQLGEQEAAIGGGNTPLVTGSQTEPLSALAANASQNQAASLSKIQQAGYAQGNQNYNQALGTSLSAASLENPSAIGQEANSASNTAFGESTTVNNITSANSVWPEVGGLAGSLIGSFFGGPIGGYVGGKVGTTLGGIGNATSGTYTPTQN
jgi:hypothetical protein